MKTSDLAAKSYHPSNELHNERVHDFQEAMTLYVQQFEAENALFPDDPPCDVETARKRAAEAKEIYCRVVANATYNAAKEMRDRGLGEFADALESGSYAGLAI